MTFTSALFGGAILTGIILLMAAGIVFIAWLLRDYPFVFFTFGVMLIWLMCSVYICSGGFVTWMK